MQTTNGWQRCRAAQKEIKSTSQARIQKERGQEKGKSIGDGVFDRFAAKEWISLECLFSGRGMTNSSTASFSHFIVWPPSYQTATVFPSCVCGLSWFGWR
jgi:hypothetical protein